ncbi:MAG: hypothetical protein ACLFWB_11255 [Armatimonadota bacterium]
MPEFEYQVISHDIRARIAHLNKKLEELVAEGWSPVSFAGNEHINIMLRRPKSENQQAGEGEQ